MTIALTEITGNSASGSLFPSTDGYLVITYLASLLIACQNFRKHSNIIHMMFFANFCTEICLFCIELTRENVLDHFYSYLEVFNIRNEEVTSVLRKIMFLMSRERGNSLRVLDAIILLLPEVTDSKLIEELIYLNP